MIIVECKRVLGRYNNRLIYIFVNIYFTKYKFVNIKKIEAKFSFHKCIDILTEKYKKYNTMYI